MTCTLWKVDINMSATQNAKLQRMDFSAYVSYVHDSMSLFRMRVLHKSSVRLQSELS